MEGVGAGGGEGGKEGGEGGGGRVRTRQRVAERAHVHTHTYVHMRACIREVTCIQIYTSDSAITRTGQEQACFPQSVSSGCAATR